MAKLTLTKSGVARPLCGVALLCTVAGNAQAAEVTANVGYMSEYIFRGIPQADSAAMGGLDLKSSGLYLGTWAADVGDGLEVDLYGGYNGSVGDFTYGVGATGYFYTDDFDDTYKEVNLSLGWKIFSVAAAFGRYDNFEGQIDGGEGAAPNETENYTYIAPRVDYQGFYGLVGIFGNDFDGEYYEAGYGSQFEPIGLDWKVSVIHSTEDLLGDDDDNSLVFTISKTFALTK